MLEMRAKIDTRPGAWSSWWAIGDFENVPWPKTLGSHRPTALFHQGGPCQSKECT